MLFDKDVFKGNNNFNEEFIVLDEDVEILNEFNIHKNDKYRRSIAVDPDGGDRFKYTPYFKFCKGPGYKQFGKCQNIARIPIKPDNEGNFSYYVHPAGIGRHFNLTKEDFDILEIILRLPLETGNFTGTVWEKIIETANGIIRSDKGDSSLYLIDNIEIPDYRHLLRKV